MTDIRPPRELVVDAVRTEAKGVVSIRLVAPDRSPLEPWEPGAHLQFTLASGLIRHYSLCGDPGDARAYTVAVLREPGGRGGSVEMHDTLTPGTTLTVRGPRNNFHLADAERYLFIAGGIGITPIAAMVREAHSRDADWRLVYGGRSRASMAFASELAALAPDRVELVPQDEHGFPDLAGALAWCDAATPVYCCGPEGMLAAAEVATDARGDGVTLHIERFVSSDETPAPGPGATGFEVELAASGIVISVPPDRSILDCVLDVLPDAEFSCMEGHCGTCEVAVLEGEPEHHDEVLTDEEHEANLSMMICVGRCKSARLVIDL
jgi:ferredoxin-NADP reductase